MPERFTHQALASVGAMGMSSENSVHGSQIREGYYSQLLSFSSLRSWSSCQDAMSVCWGNSTHLYTSASSQGFPLLEWSQVMLERFAYQVLAVVGAMGMLNKIFFVIVSLEMIIILDI